MPVIPALGRLRQEDLELQDSLDHKEELVSKTKEKIVEIWAIFLNDYLFKRISGGKQKPRRG
jgi:hypothetical protein